MPLTKSLFINHYKRLGINYNASQDEVKRAFRRLAKLTHPDRLKGDKLSFVNIYASYEVLADAQNRKQYDRQYHEYFSFLKEHNSQKQDIIRYKKIPASRLHFPTKLSVLLQHGLLGNKMKSRHIRYFLGINYDMELHLKKDEFECPILAELPVTTRAICPECLGSGPHCLSCKGVGSYKTNSFFELKLLGGILPNFIITVDLRNQKPQDINNFTNSQTPVSSRNLFHFKKSKLLVKTVLL